MNKDLDERFLDALKAGGLSEEVMGIVASNELVSDALAQDIARRVDKLVRAIEGAIEIHRSGRAESPVMKAEELQGGVEKLRQKGLKVTDDNVAKELGIPRHVLFSRLRRQPELRRKYREMKEAAKRKTPEP